MPSLGRPKGIAPMGRSYRLSGQGGAPEVEPRGTTGREPSGADAVFSGPGRWGSPGGASRRVA